MDYVLGPVAIGVYAFHRDDQEVSGSCDFQSETGVDLASHIWGSFQRAVPMLR